MIIWTINATIAYTDDSWKSISLINDDGGGTRILGGTMTDLAVLAYDPTYKQFLAAMGRSAPTGGFPSNVVDVVYRISCTLTNGYVHEFSSTDGMPTSSDDFTTVAAILNADPTFTAALDAIYPSSTPSIPQIILTISGLIAGQKFLGFGNGIHLVDPTIYRTTPDEYWVKWSGGTPFMPSSALVFGLTSGMFSGFTMAVVKRGSTMLVEGFATSYWGKFYSAGIYSCTFPFTSGIPTTKIKNRAFGSLVTDTGITISWQRAPNWPSNP